MRINYISTLFAAMGIALLVIAGCSSQDEVKCQISEPRDNPVSLELAKAFASEKVALNNRPFNWTYVGGEEVYGSNGNKNYYLLVFRKEGASGASTLEELEDNAGLFPISNNSDSKYRFDDVAIIMTSAFKEVSPLQRHFRGLPDSLANKKKIREYVEGKYPGKSLGRLVDDLPGTSYYEIVNSASKLPSGKVISVGDLAIKDISSLSAQREKVRKRGEMYYSTSSEEGRAKAELCKMLQKAHADAVSQNIAEWSKFE